MCGGRWQAETIAKLLKTRYIGQITNNKLGRIYGK